MCETRERVQQYRAKRRKFEELREFAYTQERLEATKMMMSYEQMW